MGTTLAEKVWADHLVRQGQDGAPDLIYIDLQLMHEVTSPQAFEGLRAAHRQLRRPELTIATEDHNTPTVNIDMPIADKTPHCRSRRWRATARSSASVCMHWGMPIRASSTRWDRSSDSPNRV